MRHAAVLGLALVACAAVAQTDSFSGTAMQLSTTPPPNESVGGSTGTSNRAMRADAQIPRITRVGLATTDSGGNWSIAWADPLTAAPVTLPIPVNATTQPVICNVATTTMTNATGRCWYSRTLPATLSLLSGLVSYDIFGASASGIAVQVLAIPKTQ